MTRDVATLPPPVTAPARRSTWRFRALITAIVLTTAGLVGWVAVQQRAVPVAAVDAPVRPSVRQIEHADEVGLRLRRLDQTDVQRFENRADALAPPSTVPPQLRRLEQAETRSQPEGERPVARPGQF